MKRTILLLCAVFALLLAGCGKTPQRDDTDPGQGPQSVDTTDVVYADVVTPKTFELRVPPEDRNQAYNLDFVETQEAYYYIGQKVTEDSFVNLIYFCPRGGNSFQPLCGKPNCKHEDENCNAFCGLELGYFDGALYTTNPDMEKVEIIKMNLDGTDHQPVTTVYPGLGTQRFGYNCRIHHGKLLIWSDIAKDRLSTEREHHMIVVDLSDYSQSEPAADYYNTAEYVPHFMHQFYKDKAYGTVYRANDMTALLELDTATGDVQFREIGDATGFYVTDSVLYFFLPDASKLPPIPGADNGELVPGFWELDLQSGEIRDCGLPVDDILNALYDEDFIYATSFYSSDGKDSTLYFLTRDYQLADKIELTDGLGIAAVTSDRIFFYGSTANQQITHYIEKSQIGSHKLTLIPIETVG